MFPLTSMQMSMLYESRDTDQPWLNLEQVVVHFDHQEVCPQAVRTAWQEIAERHDALRLVFNWGQGETPGQRVVDEFAVNLESLFWQDIPRADQPEKLEQFIRADRTAGVDIGTKPAWRVHLVQLGEAGSVMILTVHHAIVDGRSLGQITREFLVHLKKGSLADVPAPRVSFRSFCEALEADSPFHSEAEDYFRTYLSDFDTIGTLELPDFGEETASSQRKTHFDATMSEITTNRLNELAIETGGTSANLVQAAWGIVLARWQGRDEVAFGTVRSGRHSVAHIQETVGCFINSLPLRMRMERDVTLGEVVSKLRGDTLALHRFEQTPMDMLRKWSGLHGSQPLFQSLVMFERSSLEQMVVADTDFSPSPRIDLREEGGLPVTLAAYGGSRMRFLFEFDPSVIPNGVARRLFDSFLRLLDAMTNAQATTPIGALKMLAQDELTSLMALARPEISVTDQQTCLVSQFKSVATGCPDAIAIETADQTDVVSYGELDHRSDALAHALRRKGVGTGNVVAVQLERSADFVTAVLAVLKTGAAFLPVDPSYPSAARSFMLSDSGAVAVIANEGSETSLPVIAPTQPAPGEPLPLPSGDPTDRAYVIYTSGSTGTPKGVQVSRHNLLSHIDALSREFMMTKSDRVLQFASLSFDVALEEVFVTLMSGATLVLRSDEMAQSTSVFVDCCNTLRVTVLNLPTAFWSVLTGYLSDGDKSMPDSLRLVIVGGEQVKPQSLTAWLKAVPDVRWLNGYGPTETTITCTLYEADTGSAQSVSEVPIGRPTAHATTYIVAADGSLAPMGAVGELVIGGDAVATGYIGRPEENARGFLDDPFSGHGRIYRSGDFAQWRTDENLRFIGRQDRQLKVRGFRIDPAHVERVIETIDPSYRALVGVLNENTPSARLVAWFTTDDPGETPDCSTLDRELAMRLPMHMRPELVFVPEFARTAGGKIDRSSLPQPNMPDQTHVESGPPAIGMEADIAKAMARVLRRETIGPDQSFYDLGGHSLLSVELIGRLEKLAGRRLSITDFQNNPTPRQLVKILKTGSLGSKHIIPIQPNGSRPPALAIHILGGKEDYFRPMSKYLGSDQPVLGVSVGSLDENTPTGIEFTARRYCEDINRHLPDVPLYLMAVSLGSYMAFELARQLVDSGRDVRRLMFFDAAGPDGRDEATGWRRQLAHLKSVRAVGFSYPAQFMRARIYDIRNFFVAKRIHRAAQTNAGTSPMTVHEFIASNELAVKTYVPSPLNVPITIFRSETNFLDTPVSRATGLGWSSVAAAGYEVIDVPGGHLSMFLEPHIQVLSEYIQEVMERS
ncbi:amino acid adenylation domain-containing protein [Aliisedimentitalea scapharcae]|uniref:Amino acid adenylation domain-containing protein n=1 Tax=Aliisedimentitalea scapharcae TaxID=1524259 RepID=A0ABZ2XRC0_9RHOB